MTSDTTADLLQEMTYVRSMNYARTRLLEVTGPKTSGKEKKVSPPALLAQTATTGPHGTSRSALPSSSDDDHATTNTAQ